MWEKKIHKKAKSTSSTISKVDSLKGLADKCLAKLIRKEREKVEIDNIMEKYIYLQV